MISRPGEIGIVLAALLSGRGVAEGQDTWHTIDHVSWFAGCWERARGSVVTEERWGVPRGGMMVGTSQTVRAGETVEYEFLRVFERNGRLVYEAHPSGQAMNQFKSTRVAAAEVVFEDPEHEFPQFIAYVRLSPDSIEARIGGIRNGERTVSFPYQRISCEGGR